MPRVLAAGSATDGPIERDGELYCPLCDTQLEQWMDDGEGSKLCLQPGYGFAYGGGIGTYYYCDKEDCDWFFKELDQDSSTEPEEEETA